jgi:hypothetical protein
MKRIAAVITYWCRHKYRPVSPDSQTLMSDITNSRKNGGTLEEFYRDQVTNAMYLLAPVLNFKMPDPYTVETEELEYALLELEEKFEHEGITPAPTRQGKNHSDDDTGSADEYEDLIVDMYDGNNQGEFAAVAELVSPNPAERPSKSPGPQRSITLTRQNDIVEVAQAEINLTTSISRPRGVAWRMVRWLSKRIHSGKIRHEGNNTGTYEQDRRFLYNLFIQAIRNATGAQVVAGNYSFSDQKMSIDQLWNHYFTDLSQNIGPQLAAARFDTAVNGSWQKKKFQTLISDLRNVSPIWLIALVIALILDALTTYVSLDQTPMDGMMVAYSPP